MRYRDIANAVQRGYVDSVLIGPLAKRLESLLKPWISEAVDLFGLPPSRSQQVKAAALARAKKEIRLPRWQKTLRKRLKTHIKRAIGDDEVSAEEAEELIRAAAKRYLSGWVRVVARTEAHRASQAAALVILRAAKIKRKQWITRQDSRVRHDHTKLHRQIRPFKVPFQIPGTNLRAQRPGAFGRKDQDIGCRCIMIPFGQLPGINKFWRQLEAALTKWERSAEGAIGNGVEAGLVRAIGFLPGDKPKKKAPAKKKVPTKKKVPVKKKKAPAKKKKVLSKAQKEAAKKKKAADKKAKKEAERKEVERILGITENTKKPLKNVKKMSDAEIIEEFKRYTTMSRKEFDRMLLGHDRPAKNRKVHPTLANVLSGYIAGNTKGMLSIHPNVFKLITNVELPADTPPLFRGLSLDKELVKTLKPGATFDLREISSFSKDPLQAESFAKSTFGTNVLLKIAKPKKGADVSSFSQLQDEQEVILSGEMKIKEVTSTLRNGRRFIEVELDYPEVKKGAKKTSEIDKTYNSIRKRFEENSLSWLNASTHKRLVANNFSQAERDFVDAVTLFTNGPVEAMRDPAKFNEKKVKGTVVNRSVLRGGIWYETHVTQDTVDRGHETLKAMASRTVKPGDNTASKVWRGMGLSKRAASKLEVGQEFDMSSVSSWSEDIDVATDFSEKNGAVPTIWELAPKKGTHIGRISHMRDEAEFLTGGKFRITSVRREAVEVDGVKLTGERVFVRVEHVD